MTTEWQTIVLNCIDSSFLPHQDTDPERTTRFELIDGVGIKRKHPRMEAGEDAKPVAHIGMNLNRLGKRVVVRKILLVH